jgi:hypothetical protein
VESDLLEETIIFPSQEVGTMEAEDALKDGQESFPER